MKTAAKAALITAAAFILLGLCMIFGSFALGANPHTVGENLGGGVHIKIDSHGIHSDDRYHDDYDDRYDDYDDYDDYNEEFEDKLEDWLEQNPGIDADFGDIF